MSQKEFKRIIGYEQDWIGSPHWPIYEILCPECNQWGKDYGEVDTLKDGIVRPLCSSCGTLVLDELAAEMAEVPSTSSMGDL